MYYHTIVLLVCDGVVMATSRKCVNSPDSFCYICGEYTLKSQKRAMTPMIKYACEHYFGCKIGDQDKNWAPHICCGTYAVLLLSLIHISEPTRLLSISYAVFCL